MLGTNTDHQPLERSLSHALAARSAAALPAPVAITTKGALVARASICSRRWRDGLVQVMFSIRP
jgi:hypothetical protein